jgi:hypothetical protein
MSNRSAKDDEVFFIPFGDSPIDTHFPDTRAALEDVIVFCSANSLEPPLFVTCFYN